MKFEKIKSHAKINLSLNVLGKKKSKLHNLETLVGFLDLHDVINIEISNFNSIEISNESTFIFIKYFFSMFQHFLR